MKNVVIVSAVRTPIGAFNGSLASVPASTLGQTAIEAAMAHASITGNDVNDVVMGQVLCAGSGQNPARQAAVQAGIPVDRTAVTINQVCGSGLRAIAMGYQAVACGDADIVIAGGQESMSLAPHCAHLRNGQKMGDLNYVDTMIKDGLWDAFNGYHMGTTAENVADKWSIDRETQDAFAAASQQKAEAAQLGGKFADEIVPVTIETRRDTQTIEQDEYPRHGTTAESLSKLRPAFQKDGSVTAGNASGINDGAAATVMMSEEQAQKRGLTPLARVASWATAGVDPAVMGSGPIPASQAALKKAGWTAEDLDLIEANEAFAAQACAVNNTICLLYTSPSPRDGLLSRMPSSA